MASWGSVVLLVPRRWQQTTALKPHTNRDIGVPPLWGHQCRGFCVSRSHSEVTLPQEQAKERWHPQLSSCGDSAKGGTSQVLSHGCHPHTGAGRAALCPFQVLHPRRTATILFSFLFLHNSFLINFKTCLWEQLSGLDRIHWENWDEASPGSQDGEDGRGGMKGWPETLENVARGSHPAVLSFPQGRASPGQTAHPSRARGCPGCP